MLNFLKKIQITLIMLMAITIFDTLNNNACCNLPPTIINSDIDINKQLLYLKHNVF
jgi:hypothetical protein